MTKFKNIFYILACIFLLSACKDKEFKFFLIPDDLDSGENYTYLTLRASGTPDTCREGISCTNADYGRWSDTGLKVNKDDKITVNVKGEIQTCSNNVEYIVLSPSSPYFANLNNIAAIRSIYFNNIKILNDTPSQNATLNNGYNCLYLNINKLDGIIGEQINAYNNIMPAREGFSTELARRINENKLCTGIIFTASDISPILEGYEGLNFSNNYLSSINSKGGQISVHKNDMIQIVPEEYSYYLTAASPIQNGVWYQSIKPSNFNKAPTANYNEINIGGIGTEVYIGQIKVNDEKLIFGDPYHNFTHNNYGLALTSLYDGILSFKLNDDVKNGSYTLKVSSIGCSATNGQKNSFGNGQIMIKIPKDNGSCDTNDNFILYEASGPDFSFNATEKGKLCMRVKTDSYQNAYGEYKVSVETFRAASFSNSKFTQGLIGFVLDPFAFYQSNGAGAQDNGFIGGEKLKEKYLNYYTIEGSSAVNQLSTNAMTTQLASSAATIYKKITVDNQFIFYLRIFATLAMMIYAMFFILGAVQHKLSDTLITIIKISIVVFVLSPTSWNFFYDHMFTIFFEGTNRVIAEATGSDMETQGTFYFLDRILNVLLNWKILGAIFSIVGSIFLSIIGFLMNETIPPIFAPVAILIAIMVLLALIILFFEAFIYMFRAMFHVIMTYLKSMIVMAFLISLTPFFIIAMLFRITQGMFQKWRNLIINAAIAPILSAIAMTFLFEVYLDILKSILDFHAILHFDTWYIDYISIPIANFVPRYEMIVPNVDPAHYAVFLTVNLIMLKIITAIAPQALSIIDGLSAMLADCSLLFARIKNEIQGRGGKSSIEKMRDKAEGKEDEGGEDGGGESSNNSGGDATDATGDTGGK